MLKIIYFQAILVQLVYSQIKTLIAGGCPAAGSSAVTIPIITSMYIDKNLDIYTYHSPQLGFKKISPSGQSNPLSKYTVPVLSFQELTSGFIYDIYRTGKDMIKSRNNGNSSFFPNFASIINDLGNYAIIDKNNAIYYYSSNCIKTLSSGDVTTAFGSCELSDTQDGAATFEPISSVGWMTYSPFYNTIYIGASDFIQTINLETKVVKTMKNLTKDHEFFQYNPPTVGTTEKLGIFSDSKGNLYLDGNIYNPSTGFYAKSAVQKGSIVEYNSGTVIDYVKCEIDNYVLVNKVTPCGKGSMTYKRSGTSSSNVYECSACPASKYQPNSFFTSSCLNCPDGQYSTSIASSECNPVPAGQGAFNSYRFFCAPGQYSAKGDGFCKYCPAGYSSSYGASNCYKCANGYTSFAGGVCVSGNSSPSSTSASVTSSLILQSPSSALTSISPNSSPTPSPAPTPVPTSVATTAPSFVATTALIPVPSFVDPIASTPAATPIPDPPNVSPADLSYSATTSSVSSALKSTPATTPATTPASTLSSTWPSSSPSGSPYSQTFIAGSCPYSGSSFDGKGSSAIIPPIYSMHIDKKLNVFTYHSDYSFKKISADGSVSTFKNYSVPELTIQELTSGYIYDIYQNQSYSYNYLKGSYDYFTTTTIKSRNGGDISKISFPNSITIDYYGLAIIDKTNQTYYYSNYCIKKLSSSMATTVFGKCGTSGTQDGTGTTALFSSVDWMTYSPFYNSIYIGVSSVYPYTVRSINLETSAVKTLNKDHEFYEYNNYYAILSSDLKGNLYLDGDIYNPFTKIHIKDGIPTYAVVEYNSGTAVDYDYCSSYNFVMVYKIKTRVN